ncbi:MAG: hypothetical protein JW753_09320 [Dehalococcoidia bacterium]|nr:hypothetical protein [Dehalococcoidia bacterium]
MLAIAEFRGPFQASEYLVMIIMITCYLAIFLIARGMVREAGQTPPQNRITTPDRTTSDSCINPLLTQFLGEEK